MYIRNNGTQTTIRSHPAVNGLDDFEDAIEFNDEGIARVPKSVGQALVEAEEHVEVERREDNK